jgi:hypothetical protein
MVLNRPRDSRYPGKPDYVHVRLEGCDDEWRLQET